MHIARDWVFNKISRNISIVYYFIPTLVFIKIKYSFSNFWIIIFNHNFFFTVSYVLKDIEDKDPSYIVIDEYIGQSIAILFCEQNILEFVSAFFLFRFFDIIKPFPINYFDKQNTSFGLLMDDITAGLIAGIITYFFFKI